MAIVILFSLGFSGISVMVAASAKSQETFWGVINFLGMPLFMLSPALFPLELLPEWLAAIAKLNPVQYFRGIVDAQVVAFTTTSSAGTLPVSMKCARENLGVSKGVSKV